ncbi:hypothetical protein BpHYR1_052678 [Brachionus plicatilis]|uniref:Uncharacterized protein n=1 Tax=Brachionus plicatilis TaxID=10195 RepID=A0A3M7Q4J7_BRAPC|nr:hypothetical protein BpHYR1_052678 [Brachionus plicatilis]
MIKILFFEPFFKVRLEICFGSFHFVSPFVKNIIGFNISLNFNLSKTKDLFLNTFFCFFFNLESESQTHALLFVFNFFKADFSIYSTGQKILIRIKNSDF